MLDTSHLRRNKTTNNIEENQMDPQTYGFATTPRGINYRCHELYETLSAKQKLLTNGLSGIIKMPANR